MTELLSLKGDEKVLEIGTGSGYQSAVLSTLSAEVHTVERIPSLASRAEQLFKDLNYGNVHVHISDGTIGLPDYAPFDCILVTAGAPDIPEQYINQMNVGGRLVIPVGSRYAQTLYRIQKTSEGTEKQESTACIFVPLIGKEGWSSDNDY
jgi:protein-L-isoaspartate(D-aspartate) O-methyltransferase